MQNITLNPPTFANKKIEKLLIPPTTTAKEALKRMDAGGEKILIVVDEATKLIATLTDGDIRRWILKDGGLEAPVSHFFNAHPRMVLPNQDLAYAKKVMVREKVEVVPVVDETHVLVDALFRADLFSGVFKRHHASLKVPILIMAGGKGTRMDPVTRVLPKPLIPLGEKPIVEIIMDRFSEHGCENFYLFVNYKAKMIQSYFENEDCKHNIIMIHESSPGGTAGSLRQALAANKAASFFVTNCDILVQAEYDDIFQFHNKSNADITLVGSMQHLSVPYGVLETKSGGTLEQIIEKPEYDMLVNTGMYVVKREVLARIPKGKRYDFTDLIADVKASGGRVHVYPISEQSWIDVGQWQEYQKAVRKLEP
jgi:dTDP-glucose pyrophosphorylase